MAGVKDGPESAQLVTRSTVSDGVALVTVRGEVDLANVPALERALLPLLARSDVDVLVVDLSGVQFLDSSAIAVLLRARSSGKAVLLREPSTAVRQLIEVTGLGDVLRTES
ncbi:STAS domain-containing protein [Jatrophihabitans cynanchi]|jgi:anti-sigma B factor antagonist|uniref:Anti-sigma factor antagonist n=1 Tax=Jatrophihabitans cynanchi TaxID=2944128 RepID=A0ABY7K0I5_9ACTN|nr:STAS domain-containing protein [Jatrophihabitans sp. SB3-54]WAX57680.1 STAS domain-containing protein [Jatrophihabitans sp. SB3-54]